MIYETSGIKYSKVNDEVYYAEGPIAKINKPLIDHMKGTLSKNKRKRVRLCTHRTTDDTIHEMFIVLAHGVYIRPHRHRDKSESFHILEGLVDVVLFDDDGKIIEVVQLGEISTERMFYYRIADPYYHMPVIRSNTAVIHETTNGPFVREDTEFALWAPSEDNEQFACDYMAKLLRGINSFSLVEG